MADSSQNKSPLLGVEAAYLQVPPVRPIGGVQLVGRDDAACCVEVVLLFVGSYLVGANQRHFISVLAHVHQERAHSVWVPAKALYLLLVNLHAAQIVGQHHVLVVVDHNLDLIPLIFGNHLAVNLLCHGLARVRVSQEAVNVLIVEGAQR